MSTSKHIDRICIAITLIAVLITVLFMNGKHFGLQTVSASPAYASLLFDDSYVHTIDIIMDDWDEFIDNAENEEYYDCNLVIDGEAFKNVAIRGKGNTSLSQVSQMNSERYSFKIEFDHYQSSITYHGLDKLSLNNLIQDNTFMKDYLVYRLMDDFEVDASLTSYVYISVNGQDWGLYLAVEGVEDAFLSRNYGKIGGDLYKPDSLSLGGGRGNGRDFDMDEFMSEYFGDEDEDDNSGGSIENSTDDSSKTIVGGAAQGIGGNQPPQGSADGAVGESEDGAPQGSADGAVGESEDGAPQGSADGAVGESEDGAPQGSADGAVGESEDGAPQGSADGAVDAEIKVSGDNVNSQELGESGQAGETLPLQQENGNLQGGQGQQGSQGQQIFPQFDESEWEEQLTGIPQMQGMFAEGITSPEGAAPPDGMTEGGTFSFPDNGNMGMGLGGGGMEGSSDVKLQYIDDNPDSYPDIFDNAKTDITEEDKDRLISSLKLLSSYEDLEDILNIDEVVRYFVVHIFSVNGDSYTGSMVHNYYLRESEGQFTMIPWDYNLAFGTFQNSDATSAVNDPIDSPVSDDDIDSRPMVGWIFSSDEYIQMYHDYFSEFIEKYYDSGYISSLIDDTAQMIAPYVEKDPTKFCTYDEFERGVEALKTFCELRCESIEGQLEGTVPSTSEGQNEDSSSLIDASSLELSDMGTMNQGGGDMGAGDNFGGNGGGGQFPGIGSQQFSGMEGMTEGDGTMWQAGDGSSIFQGVDK